MSVLKTKEGDVDLADNGKIKLGTSDDLQIYHDGSNSYISDTGTGSLYLTASQYLALRGSDNSNLILASQGNYVKLYHNNVERLKTTSGGIDVTGSITVDGTVASLLTLHNTTNAAGVGINFSDQTNGGQTGDLNFHHADGHAPTGSGAGATFKFETSEPKLAVQIPGAGDFFVGSNKVIYDAGKSFGTHGYQKLNNGLIIQWGYGSATNHYFPIAFPNAVFNISITNNHTTNDNESMYVETLNQSYFTFRFKYTHKTRYFIAIGH